MAFLNRTGFVAAAAIVGGALCSMLVFAQTSGGEGQATADRLSQPDAPRQASDAALSRPSILEGDSVPDLIVAPGMGAIASRVLSGVDGHELVSGFPFGSTFSGGVRAAAADVSGDGVADIIVGMGPGGGLVRVIDGVDGSEVAQGAPFGAGFAGGVFVAAGDVDGDGHADVVVSQGSGGGRVRAYSGATLALVVDELPFGSSYAGGVRVAAGDVDRDGHADLMVAQAEGGLVSVLSGVTHVALASGFPYGPNVPGGVFIAAGDVDGDGRADAILGPGSGNGPVRVFDVSSVSELASFMPYDAQFEGGVRVAAADFTGDGLADIVTAPGPGAAPLIRVYTGGTFTPYASLLAFSPAFSGGVFVAAPATTLTVEAAPTITSAASVTFPSGGPASFTVTTTGVPRPTLSSTGALPAGITFTPNADGTATIAGTTAPGSVGVFPITLTASNGVGTSATQTFTLTVAVFNQAPSFTAGPNQSVAEDSGAQSVGGWATAISAGPGEATQTLTFLASSTNPSLFSVPPAVSPTGTLTYTPAPNQNGSATVTVTLEDDGGTANGGVDTSAPRTLIIDVTAVNDAPVALPKAFAAHTNLRVMLTGLTAGVTDTDSGINGCTPAFSVAAVSATSPVGGTVTITNAAAGVVDFDPPPATTGVFTFTYQVSDSGCPGPALSAPAMVTVTVAGPVIWFADAAAPPGGDGRLSHPFNALPGLIAATTPNDRLFLFSGSYASSFALKSGQTVIGQGATSPATFDALMGIVPPPGTMARPVLGGIRPIVQGTVTLAANVRLQGLDVAPASGIIGIADPAGSITGVSVSEVSVSTSNAPALSLSDVSGALSFTSVSTNGGTHGVTLQDMSGTVVVTGAGGPGSGGTIQNTTSDGVLLTNTQGVSLASMLVRNNLGSGLLGTNVSGLDFNGSSFVNNGDENLEAGIEINNLTGTAHWTSLSVSGSPTANVLIDNATGTLDDLTIDGASVFSNLSTMFGNSAILVQVRGTAVLTGATITGATFASNTTSFGISLLTQGSARIGDVPPATTNTFTIQNSSFTDNAGHIRIEQSGSSNVAVRVLDNLTMLRATNSHAIEVSSAAATGGTVRGRIQGNAIGNAAQVASGSGFGAGIQSRIIGLATWTLLIDDNVIRQVPAGRGINIQADGSGTEAAGPTSNLTVTNNDVNPQNTNGFPAAAIRLVVFSAGGGPVTARTDVRGNTVPPGMSVDDLQAFLLVDGSVQLVDTAPASASCTAQLTETNTGNAVAGVGCTLIGGPIDEPPLFADVSATPIAP